MNSAIEAGRKPAYRAPMRPAFLRLLAIVAVMLMPFGMAAAPAASIHHQEMAKAMPMEHCPEPASTPQSNGTLAHCSMACAAALPVVNSPALVPHLTVRSLPSAPMIGILSGTEPEIATPPPRLV